MKKKLMVILMLPIVLFAQKDMGVYFPMWMMDPAHGNDHFSPATMDWTKITWGVAFAVNVDPSKKPYLNVLTGHFVNGVPTNGTDSAAFEYNYKTTNWLQSLITNGHTNSAKIYLGIDMVDPTALKQVIALGEDSVDLFAKEVVAYCNRKGFDGVDLNIETWTVSPPTPTEISMLFRHFKKWMTTYAKSCSLLSIAPGQGNSNVYQKDSVNFYIDAVHIQFYAYDPVWYSTPINANTTWYINPLRRGTGLPAVFEGSGIETDIQKWVNAGYKKSKLNIGISTFAYVHRDVDSVAKVVSSTGYETYDYVKTALTKGGTSHWDNIRKATWIGGTATSAFGSGQSAVSIGQKFYITTPSDSNTYYIMKYSIDSGYGGVWFYDLSMDHSESSNPKNPIINYAQKLQLSQSLPRASKATISPAGLSILANGKSTLTINVQAKDSIGGNLTYGGDVVQLFTSSGALSIILDNSNGTYSSILTSSKIVGLTKITGTINGKPISDTGKVYFSSTIDGRTLISASPSSIPANGTSTSTITVQSKDTNGININTGGAIVTLNTTAGSLSDVVDNNNGKYTSILTSSTVGGGAIIFGIINGATISDTATVIFTNIQSVINRNGTDIPTNFELGQNYPNPFNPSTSIKFALPISTHVQIKVYDLSGREVATLVDNHMDAGRYSVRFDASVPSRNQDSAISSGVYLYRIETPIYSETKKLVLIK